MPDRTALDDRASGSARRPLLAAAPLGRRASRPAAALTVDLEAALALVDPRLRVERATPLSGGIVSSVFEVATNDGRSLVVKIWPEEQRWKLDKEISTLRLLEQRELAAPVPVVLAVDGHVAVITKLEGVLVRSVEQQLGDEGLVQVNRQIGAFLRSLHEVRFERFEGGLETNLDLMRARFELRLRMFVEHGGDDGLARRIADHVAEREWAFVDCPHAVLCHNDCHYANVLVDGRRVTGVLDFEGVLAGDPLLDLAKTYCYGPRRTETLLSALVDGYGDVRADWREAIDLYVLFHRLELWGFLASFGQTDLLGELAEAMRDGI